MQLQIVLLADRQWGNMQLQLVQLQISREEEVQYSKKKGSYQLKGRRCFPTSTWRRFIARVHNIRNTNDRHRGAGAGGEVERAGDALQPDGQARMKAGHARNVVDSPARRRRRRAQGRGEIQTPFVGLSSDSGGCYLLMVKVHFNKIKRQ
jgi:hypothetical protein